MKTITIGLILLSFIACKNSEQTPSQESNNKNKNINSNEIIYDVIISFTSMGEGIDNSLKKEVDSLIAKYNNKHHLNIKPEKVNWGREGEVDYNISLKNLSTAKKKEFISAIKEMVGISELTIIRLNRTAVHKR